MNLIIWAANMDTNPGFATGTHKTVSFDDIVISTKEVGPDYIIGDSNNFYDKNNNTLIDNEEIPFIIILSRKTGMQL